MSMKKYFSLVVAVVMLLTAVAVPALAEGKDYTLSLTGAAVAKYEGTYELSVVLNTNAAVLGTGFRITFNDTLFDFTSFTPVDAPQFTANATRIEEGVVECASSGDGKAYAGVWGKLTFTAAAGTDAAPAEFACVADATNNVSFMDARSQQIANDAIDFGSALDINVVSTHTAPTISGVTITSPATVGTELTATTVDFVDSWGLEEASTFVWTIDGEEVSVENTYTPVAKDINKTITVTATPAVAEEEGMDEGTNVGEAKTATATVVLPEGYAPTASVAIADENGEVLASTDIEAKMTYGNTYDAVTKYVPTYAWYVVPAEDVDAAVEASEEETTALAEAIAIVTAGTNENIVALGDAATQKFDAALYKDDYAVVKVAVTGTINGGEIPAIADAYAAAKITGEPPMLDEVANGDKLAAKKLFTTSVVTVKESDVKFNSMAVGEDKSIDYTYNFSLATSLDDEAPVAITGEAVNGNQLRLSKVENAEGKYLVIEVIATDALNISSAIEIRVTTAIAKASGGSGTPGGASLVTGTTVTPGTDEPGTDEPGTDEPGTDEPATDDPSGDAIANGAAAFTDVDKEAYAWAYEGIDVLAKAGVIKGMTETTFGPELTATNAQVIALAVRIAGLTAEDAATEAVDAEHWVYEEMAIADANDILGVFGGAIDVEAATTREVAFTLLYNALKAAGVELPTDAEAIEYSDAASIDAACVEAIEALTKAGIINGMGDGTLAPKATITRAQLAKILGMANALIG